MLKNKNSFIIISIVALLLILLVPIPMKSKCATSTEYRAILYKITNSGCVDGLEISILGHQIYYKTNKDIDEKNDNYDKDLLKCLENGLGGYILTEKDNLTEIPLNKIKNSNTEKIAYYKGVYASKIQTICM